MENPQTVGGVTENNAKARQQKLRDSLLIKKQPVRKNKNKYFASHWFFLSSWRGFFMPVLIYRMFCFKIFCCMITILFFFINF